MIQLSEYSDAIDDLARGDTIGVCHMGCPAGEDTRYRLYLTKPASSPNVVLGYCHNCNGSGVIRDSDDRQFRDFQYKSPSSYKKVVFDPPDNMAACGDRWPATAHAWRIGKRLTIEQCGDMGIKYDPATHRVYLPVWRNIDPMPRELLGYQLRQLDGSAPKYLTAQKEQDTILYTVIRPFPTMCRHYVLVEDFASGLAIMEAIFAHPLECSNIGVLVNYGVKTKVEALNDCVRMEAGYVWLDNDGQHILDRSTSIAKTWALVTGAEVRQNLTSVDPKQYSNDEIVDTLKEGGLW